MSEWIEMCHYHLKKTPSFKQWTKMDTVRNKKNTCYRLVE